MFTMDITNYKLKNFVISGDQEDYIFSIIRDTNNFYEHEILDKWNKYLSNVKVILDIGANIGNHSIYWSQFDNIEKIIAFEAVKSIYEILARNVNNNNIAKIELHNLAVGEKDGYAEIDKFDKNNYGSTSLKVVDESEIKIVSVDNFLSNKDLQIDFVKIDVEEFEVFVLNGMKHTIAKDKPIIWVEVSLNTLNKVLEVFKNEEYRIVDIKKFNILAVHESKMNSFKPITQEKIITEVFKNLSASWIYRNNSQNLEERLKKSASRFEYEQKKSIEIKKQLERSVSRFNYEQKKCEDLQEQVQQSEKLKKQLQQSEKLVKDYKSRKVVRTVDNFQRLYSEPRTYTKKYVYITLNMLYGKLKRFPRITRLIHRTNNRFNIIHKEAALKTYYEYQSNYKSKGLSAGKNFGPQQPKDIKVAVIVDEFTYNSFKGEFNAVVIEPDNWLELFEKEKPDLFFCESAWSGVNSEKRPWKGKIYSSINFKNENRLILLSILEYCKNNSIPTIFWNKEDPTHYNDKVHNFVDTALKFDHIFTTDENCVQRYRDDYGFGNVHCLMFAGQPKLLNPIEKQTRTEDIVFAGSWYKQHPQRCYDMKDIFDKILDSGYNLKIYDRHFFTTDDPNRDFPEKYIKYTHPSVPFNEIENVYKESFYSLNINTETKSKTMFARRVFELMLCNTLVISNYSEGMEELFGDNIIFIDREELDLSNFELKRSKNLYEVLRYHTYARRFKQILDAINYEYLMPDDTITLYYTVNKQSEIKNILEHYESINYQNKKLALLISENIPNHLIKNIYEEYANNEVSVYSLYYLKYQNGMIINNTPYFIFADMQLMPESIEKSILHYSYLDKEYSITTGEFKYTFGNSNIVTNVVMKNEMFEDVSNHKLHDIPIEIRVYYI